MYAKHAIIIEPMGDCVTAPALTTNERCLAMAFYSLFDLPRQIQDKISPEPNSGCWLWTGHHNSAGYGHIHYIGKVRRAHRVVYGLLKGELSKDLQIDHLCRNRACVNPDHLEEVTRRENIKRGSCGEANKKKTHCKHGHPLSGYNLMLIKRKDPNGISGEDHVQRSCRTCFKISRKRCREIKKLISMSERLKN